MLKKSAIIGFVLLAIGGIALAWVVPEMRSEQKQAAEYKLKYGSEHDEYLKRYSEWLKLSPAERDGMPLEVNGYGQAKTKEEIRIEQRERLIADLDRLAMGELDAHPFANVLYGENWEDEVRRYGKDKERSEFILTWSVVFASIGGTTFGLSFVLWLIGFVARGASRLREGGDDYEGDELEDDDVIREEEVGYGSQKSFVDSVRATVGETCIEGDCEDEPEEPVINERGKGRKKIAVMISSDKPGKEPKAAPKAENVGGVTDMVRSSGVGKVKQPLLGQQHKEASKLEESLRAHTQKLEKQMEEFRRMHSAQQHAAGQPNPLNGTLEELAQQVSAIRDYAANQQQRVEKLQDGYDWNIIRTFCLRVIRCIDNLETRIEGLSEEGVETDHLEDVRDELIFALESSGVEQFRPEENSPYRGQEKSTEAVKEREHCTDSKKVGMIAKVVRPGYQYFIDEGNLKVVRAAQVKLFG